MFVIQLFFALLALHQCSALTDELACKVDKDCHALEHCVTRGGQQSCEPLGTFCNSHGDCGAREHCEHGWKTHGVCRTFAPNPPIHCAQEKNCPRHLICYGNGQCGPLV